MSAAPRIPRGEPVIPESPEKIDFGESMTKLFTSGVGRLAEVQKRTIDTAAQQTVEMIDFWKKTARKWPGTPAVAMLELAGSGVEHFAEAQKGVIDLVAEQSRAFADLMKERNTAAVKVTDGAMKFAQQSVERTVATHKKTLEHATAQANAAFETAKKHFGVEGGPVEAAADSMQRTVNAIVEAQKELLEIGTR